MLCESASAIPQQEQHHITEPAIPETVHPQRFLARTRPRARVNGSRCLARVLTLQGSFVHWAEALSNFQRHSHLRDMPVCVVEMVCGGGGLRVSGQWNGCAARDVQPSCMKQGLSAQPNRRSFARRLHEGALWAALGSEYPC